MQINWYQQKKRRVQVHDLEEPHAYIGFVRNDDWFLIFKHCFCKYIIWSSNISVDVHGQLIGVNCNFFFFTRKGYFCNFVYLQRRVSACIVAKYTLKKLLVGRFNSFATFALDHSSDQTRPRVHSNGPITGQLCHMIIRSGRDTS